MEATNAAHSEFVYSCGSYLDIQTYDHGQVAGQGVAKRRRLEGKQVAPFGMIFEPPFEQSFEPAKLQVVSQVAEPVLPEDADGHILMTTGPIVWCFLCGTYQSEKRTCRLREHCPKEPEHRSHYRLKRLKEGKHPTNGFPMGETTQRLTLAKQSAALGEPQLQAGSTVGRG